VGHSFSSNFSFQKPYYLLLLGLHFSIRGIIAHIVESLGKTLTKISAQTVREVYIGNRNCLTVLIVEDWFPEILEIVPIVGNPLKVLQYILRGRVSGLS